MKKSITFFCLFVFIGKSSIFALTLAAETTEECKVFRTKSPVIRLRNYLFCRYPSSADAPKSNSTAVGFEILPTFAGMNEHEYHLELDSSMYLTWIDKHLTWDPAQFDNIYYLEIPSSSILTPIIAVKSLTHEHSDEDILNRKTLCGVDHKGTIMCNPRLRNTITCENDFTLWPYDRHNCTFILTAWTQTRNLIVFKPPEMNEAAFTHILNIRGHWEITVSRVAFEHFPSKYWQTLRLSKVSVDFIVDRINPQLSKRCIVPGILITIITLMTVGLDPESKERLALACLNPIIHMLSIDDLNSILPQNINTLPNIVLIYMNSFGLAIVALLLTIFLASLRKSTNSVPKWISSTISLLLRYRIGQIVLLGMRDRRACSSIEKRDVEHDDNLVDFEHEESSWKYVVLILNWITFFSYFFIYVVIWTILVPNPSMKTPIVNVSH